MKLPGLPGLLRLEPAEIAGNQRPVLLGEALEVAADEGVAELRRETAVLYRHHVDVNNEKCYLVLNTLHMREHVHR